MALKMSDSVMLPRRSYGRTHHGSHRQRKPTYAWTYGRNWAHSVYNVLEAALNIVTGLSGNASSSLSFEGGFWRSSPQKLRSEGGELGSFPTTTSPSARLFAAQLA